MKQECVYFHTVKTIDEAEKLFKENGIEIILKNNHSSINFSDLTDEEKRTWIDEHQPSSSELLARLNKFHTDLGKYLLTLNTLDQLPYDVKKTGFVDSFSTMSSLFSTITRIHTELMPRIRYGAFFHDVSVEDDDTVECKVIIGKSGNSIIRFLEFIDNDDPIVTITGVDMHPLKESLEKIF